MLKAFGLTGFVLLCGACSGRTQDGAASGGTTSAAARGGTAATAMHSGGLATQGGSPNASHGGEGPISDGGVSTSSKSDDKASRAGGGSPTSAGGSAPAGGGARLDAGAGGEAMTGEATSGGASERGNSTGGSTEGKAGEAGAGGQSGAFPARPICGPYVISANTGWCEGIENVEATFEGIEDATGDGELSPGEEGKALVRMRNTGNVSIQSPCLGLLTSSPDVTLLESFNPKLMLFALLDGSDWLARVRFRVGSSVVAGTRIRFVAWVDSHTAGCTSGGDVEFEIEIGDSSSTQ